MEIVSLTAAEDYAIVEALGTFRNRFPGKYSHLDKEWSLFGFLVYEKCAAPDALRDAAPYVLGKILVIKHGFFWAARIDGRKRKVGVIHIPTNVFVELSCVLTAGWPQPTIEPFGPEYHEIHFYEGIVTTVGQTPAWNE